MLSCMICSGSDVEILGNHPDFPTRIMRCSGCDSVSSEWLPGQFLNEFYADQYRLARPNHLDTSYLALLGGRAAEQLRLVGTDGPGARVLDIGAGPGVLLDSLVHGVERFAIELDAELSRRLELVEGVEVLTWEELPERTGYFDLVVLSHVLEHAAHPGEMLASAALALKPGGTLLIEVPNEIEPLLSTRSLHRRNDGHLHFFCASSFENMVSKQPALSIATITSAGIAAADFSTGTPLGTFETRDDLDGLWLRAVLVRTSADVVEPNFEPDFETRLLQTLRIATDAQQRATALASKVADADDAAMARLASLAADVADAREEAESQQRLLKTERIEVARAAELTARLNQQLKDSRQQTATAERHLANTSGRILRIERENEELRASASFRLGHRIVKPLAQVRKMLPWTRRPPSEQRSSGR
ncbi:class I SAM-dependent methyltransferase [Roseibium sp.]